MLETKNVKMGYMPPSWNDGKAQTITFCVTEDCNLACKYCYMTGKNTKTKMDFSVAKKAVDYILSNRSFFNREAVIWEFIGGEPFLEIELIDRVSDYIKQQMYITEHPWFDNYRFNFSSNGVLYHLPKVQEYIQKNRGHISVGFSVDGNKIKHDLQRVKVDGSGSYDDVVKNVPLWLEQFPGASTKATFSSGDLQYLKDSVISLWDIGIKMVAANVVFEDVWQAGDDVIFEDQLRELADYVLEKEMWKEYSVRFFAPNEGLPLNKNELANNFCGAGEMLAIDCSGNFFPCIRFYDMSLGNRKGIEIGDIHTGINDDRIRPFLALNVESQSKEECIKCEVASGCGWCTGGNYDLADTDTIYQRATFICKMHKAKIRATEYFWDKFTKTTGLVSEREKYKASLRNTSQNEGRNKYLQFILSDQAIPVCSYRNRRGTTEVMSERLLTQGVEFAKKEGFIPVFLGNVKNIDLGSELEYLQINSDASKDIEENSMTVYDNCFKTPAQRVSGGTAVLLINKENINRIFEYCVNLFNYYYRVNIKLEDIQSWKDEDIHRYKTELDDLVKFISGAYTNKNFIELNILTDILHLDSMCNCHAGTTMFSLAPNGKIYMCPAFYFDDPESYVGTLEEGFKLKNKQLFALENAPICKTCDVYHCSRCKFLNQKLTGEFNTPSRIQCVISHMERNKARELQLMLEKSNISGFGNHLEEIDYMDPLDNITKNKHK